MNENNTLIEEMLKNVTGGEYGEYIPDTTPDEDVCLRCKKYEVDLDVGFTLDNSINHLHCKNYRRSGCVY